MDREILAKVLDYSILTYIDLKPKLVWEEANSPRVSPERGPRLEVLSTDSPWGRAFLETLPLGVDHQDDVVVLAVNYLPQGMLYRTVKITAIGHPDPGKLAVMTLKRQDFYRKQIYFELFDEHGNPLEVPVQLYQVR